MPRFAKGASLVEVGTLHVREEAGKSKLLRLMAELGRHATGPGRVYLVGGSSIVLLEKGRESTIGVDLKLDPEPAGIFEAIAAVKDALEGNINPALFRQAVEAAMARSDDDSA